MKPQQHHKSFGKEQAKISHGIEILNNNDFLYYKSLYSKFPFFNVHIFFCTTICNFLIQHLSVFKKKK